MEGDSSSASVSASSQSTAASSQTSAPASGNAAPVSDKANSASTGQATSQTQQSGSSQAVSTPQLDPELQSWIGAKGITVDALVKDPVKFLKMYRETESYHGKQINDLKAKYESESRISAAKAVAPESTPEPEKRPSELITAKYETAIGNLLYTLGVEDINQLYASYPQEQYPALYERVMGLNREYQGEYQKALAQDVEFLVGNQKKSSENDKAKQQFEDEWRQVKAAVNSNFDILRKENPQFDTHLKTSGVSNIVKRVADLVGVPEEYVWHDNEMSNFLREAMAGIMMKRELPSIEAKWKEQNLKTLMEQRKTEIPSATSGFNYDNANKMSGLKGVSLLR